MNDAAADARHKRKVQLGTLAVLLGAVVIALLVALSSGGDSGGDSSVEGVSEIDTELKGLEQSGLTLGDPQAPVTIVEFGDLQCPVCAQFAAEQIPTLIETDVRSGAAKLEFRNWVIIGPQSEDAARASLAAAEQGRYWSFVELFYRNQGVENSGYVTDDFLEAIAEGAGVADLDRFNEDRDDPAFDSQLAANDAAAKRAGLDGTPSFVVEGPGGTKVVGTAPAAQISAAVEAVSK